MRIQLRHLGLALGFIAIAAVSAHAQGVSDPGSGGGNIARPTSPVTHRVVQVQPWRSVARPGTQFLSVWSTMPIPVLFTVQAWRPSVGKSF